MSGLFRPTAWIVASSAEQAAAALAADPGARIVGGGTLVMQRYDVATTTLIDLTGAGLDALSIEPDGVTVGAAATLDALARAELPPGLAALSEAARGFGVAAVRRVATVGGNVAGAATFGNATPAFLALGAGVRLLSSTAGERTVPLAELYGEHGRPLLRPGELVLAVTVEDLPTWSGFDTVRRFALDHFVATVAAAVTLGPDGAIVRSAWAVGAAELRPRCLPEVAAAAQGRRPDDPGLPDLLAEAARAALAPMADHRAGADYRRHAVGVLVARLARRARG